MWNIGRRGPVFISIFFNKKFNEFLPRFVHGQFQLIGSEEMVMLEIPAFSLVEPLNYSFSSENPIRDTVQ